MTRRPLKPAPRPAAPTDEERHAQRRFTWRMLLVGVCTNIVGCAAHYIFVAPPRLGGAIARPTIPTEVRMVELPQAPGKR